MIRTNEMPDTIVIQKAIRTLREHLGYTQQRWAHHLNLGIATVVRWENSTAPGPSGLILLANIANKVNLPDVAQVLTDAMRERLKLGLLDTTLDVQTAIGRAQLKIAEVLDPEINPELGAKQRSALKTAMGFLKTAVGQLDRMNQNE